MEAGEKKVFGDHSGYANKAADIGDITSPALAAICLLCQDNINTLGSVLKSLINDLDFTRCKLYTGVKLSFHEEDNEFWSSYDEIQSIVKLGPFGGFSDVLNVLLVRRLEQLLKLNSGKDELSQENPTEVDHHLSKLIKANSVSTSLMRPQGGFPVEHDSSAVLKQIKSEPFTSEHCGHSMDRAEGISSINTPSDVSRVTPASGDVAYASHNSLSLQRKRKLCAKSSVEIRKQEITPTSKSAKETCHTTDEEVDKNPVKCYDENDFGIDSDFEMGREETHPKKRKLNILLSAQQTKGDLTILQPKRAKGKQMTLTSPSKGKKEQQALAEPQPKRTNGEQPTTASLPKREAKGQTTPNLKPKRRKGEQPFHCQKCGRRFSFQRYLENHTCKAEPQPLLVCEVCGAQCTTPCVLKSHMRTHSGERPYPCDLCDKTFLTKENRKVHMRRHLGEKPFTCEFCGFSCVTGGHLAEHRRIHTGDRPYVCEVCDQGFKRYMDRKEHYRRKHSKERPYACANCPRAFHTSSELTQHVSVHSGVKRHKCAECGKSFRTIGHLTNHKRVHSGEKLHKCADCNKAYAKAENLRHHNRTHHPDRDPTTGTCYKIPPRDSTSQDVTMVMTDIHVHVPVVYDTSQNVAMDTSTFPIMESDTKLSLDAGGR